MGVHEGGCQIVTFISIAVVWLVGIGDRDALFQTASTGGVYGGKWLNGKTEKRKTL